MMNDPETPPEVLIKRRKQLFGLSYGLTAGLAFSITLWGIDGLILARAYALLPWTKLVIGAPLAMLVCGLAGWLTSRIERPIVGIVLWTAAAGALAWLTVVIPLIVAPMALKALVPDLQSLMQFSSLENTSQMAAVGFAWIAISTFITAVVQVPMVEQAAFSTNIFGRIAPHLICLFLMLVSGSVADNLNNESLREPLVSMNATVQFALDHPGAAASSAEARAVHLASLRIVQDVVTENRRLVVGNFDPLLENVNILINFDGNWVECGTISNNPLNCAIVHP